jgi:hypothetical protein
LQRHIINTRKNSYIYKGTMFPLNPSFSFHHKREGVVGGVREVYLKIKGRGS